MAKGPWESVSSAAYQPFRLIVLGTDCPDEGGERFGPGAGGEGVASSFGRGNVTDGFAKQLYLL